MHPRGRHRHLQIIAALAVAAVWAVLFKWPGALGAVAADLPARDIGAARVSGLHGTAIVHRSGSREALQVDAAVHENQPVEVGAHSGLRLMLGERVLLELGPDARIVLPRAETARQDAATTGATWVRLERGYLRVVAPADQPSRSIGVAAGHWTALAGAGETFFESSSETLSACSQRGVVQGSGAPISRSHSSSMSCVQLVPDRAPAEMALREQDWHGVRRHRRLTARLIRPADANASDAPLTEMQAVRSAPAVLPGAFSADQLVVIPRTAATLQGALPRVPEAGSKTAQPDDPPDGDPRVRHSEAAQALLETDPPAAGPPRPRRELYRVRIPGLKWADSLESLQPDGGPSSTPGPSPRRPTIPTGP